jgi:hypothetical protein
MMRFSKPNVLVALTDPAKVAFCAVLIVTAGVVPLVRSCSSPLVSPANAIAVPPVVPADMVLGII